MSNSLNGITLPDGLHWVDEFSSIKVAQTVKSTLSGDAVVFYGQRKTGLPITLQSQSDQGWLDRTTVQSIASIADVPGAVYTLSLRGVSYSVMFRHESPPAFKAEPVLHKATPVAGDYYTATINLMTV